MVNDRSKINHAGPIEEPALQHLPDALTVEEAARVLRISRGRMYEAIRRGEIEAIHVGRTLRVSRRTLERLLG